MHNSINRKKQYTIITSHCFNISIVLIKSFKSIQIDNNDMRDGEVRGGGGGRGPEFRNKIFPMTVYSY